MHAWHPFIHSLHNAQRFSSFKDKIQSDYNTHSMASVVVIQASMLYMPTQVGPAPDASSECLSTAMRQDFASVQSETIVDAFAGLVMSGAGRLEVSESCDALCMLGDMSSVDAWSVQLFESYARVIHHPLLPFLSICVRHRLSLNKYLRSNVVSRDS